MMWHADFIKLTIVCKPSNTLQSSTYQCVQLYTSFVTWSQKNVLCVTVNTDRYYNCYINKDVSCKYCKAGLC
jgi:hypothetical protein